MKNNNIFDYFNILNDKDNINNKIKNIISLYNKVIKNENDN